MKLLIQRVTDASVAVDHKEIGRIGKGFLVLVGVGQGDNEAVADKMIRKMLNLRIFADENGKTNLSISDVRGELLIVSQFTLYADCAHGNRPGFTYAGSPDLANSLYEYILRRCAEEVPNVQHGEFGADMKVSLTNDGPFTIMLDSQDMIKKQTLTEMDQI